VESIRAGLVMHLKENIGAEYIMAREETILKRAKERLKGMENLIILGPTDVPKLPILSFLIKAPAKLGIGYLHHNFVCFILNDVFGIQARGGCACAGPYVEGLLGLMGNKLEDFVGIIQQPNNIASHVTIIKLSVL
jgi:selenocysteine lyase/cysteine desulfurase